MSQSVYFTTPDGIRYRVLDAIMREGKMVVANPPPSWARFRVFRPEAGQRRLYYFKPGESRAPEPALLELQLLPDLFVEQPELCHALGRLEDLVVRPVRI